MVSPTDVFGRIVSVTQPEIETPDVESALASSAARAFENLQRLIEEFTQGLSEDHELGAYIANNQVPFLVTDVEQKGDLFVFTGTTTLGKRVVAAEHFTRLSLQLVELEKQDRNKSNVGFLSENS